MSRNLQRTVRPVSSVASPVAAASQPRAGVIVDEPQVCTRTGIAIGSCGCGGGGGAHGGDRIIYVGPDGRVISPGMVVNNAAMPPVVAATLPPNVAGDWTVDQCPDRGCYPRSMFNDGRPGALFSRAMAEHHWRPEPYTDPLYDEANMDPLYSDITIVAAGATVDILVSPEQGTFAAYYYNVVVTDPVTGVSQVDWVIGQPNVQGCPVACNVNGPILSQWVQKIPEACCGAKFRAFLDKESENSPLVIPFTNESLGDQRVQIRVKGYCCSTKVC